MRVEEGNGWTRRKVAHMLIETIGGGTHGGWICKHNGCVVSMREVTTEAAKIHECNEVHRFLCNGFFVVE